MIKELLLIVFYKTLTYLCQENTCPHSIFSGYGFVDVGLNTIITEGITSLWGHFVSRVQNSVASGGNHPREAYIAQGHQFDEFHLIG